MNLTQGRGWGGRGGGGGGGGGEGERWREGEGGMTVIHIIIGTVEPLLYDHPQNHIGVVE